MARNIRLSAIATALAILATQPALADSQFKILHFFNGTTDGGGLFGGLIFDSAGNLYGTARDGGTPTYGYGTAFRLSPNKDGTWTNTVIHDFQTRTDYSKPDGLNPKAGLVSDSAGNLYGTAFYGGEPNDMGVVYELSPGAHGKWTEKILHKFGGKEDGRYPSSNLIFDGAGNLYGTTYGVPGYCGTVFELSPVAGGKWKETVLHDFGLSSGGKNGCEPVGGVIFDSAGNLYGTTSGGGKKIPYGDVFEPMPQAGGKWKHSVLHRFGAKDGNLPYAGLILDGSGNLYGTTFGGGDESCDPLGCGTVYKLTPSESGTWSETLIHRFTGGDGENPLGALVMDKAGNLYGTTDYGDNQSCRMGCGVIFQLSPSKGGKWNETILHAFDGSDGWGGGSNLIFDAAGNLYGTTITGGGDSVCCGVAFQIRP